MSDRRPLMPKATAVWLVENTALAFDQIAEFCGLHPLEVRGIADGEVAQGIKGMDPVTNGQLTRDEIARGEKNAGHKLQLAESKVQLPPMPQTRKGPRYTPVSRRHDRPNAVLWLLRNHPELKDSQIMRLVGTTKPTIAQIRDRTHWNSSQLTPQDPVTLGLCSQIDLDAEVKKAARRAERDRPEAEKDGDKQGTLLPTSETTAAHGTTAQILAPKAAEEAPEETPEQEQARVFAKLKGMTSVKPDAEDEDESEATPAPSNETSESKDEENSDKPKDGE
ncbi:DUF1013 domain-containing protein [Hyphomicrobium methylovorum]|uniref:DUF1013 domain-containing protein n=1 Tax=Hyphomicrobium methylovorum TaxID=84 RepID=UPI0015E72365|nr:cell cycle transcriptional regulator TrcR [Hyphomicrobium methylovorum]MBA2126837.1 DUF1013 domain-containing protein [Hyphomicrobium methylovorum]